jgi:hypothetical protein
VIIVLITVKLKEFNTEAWKPLEEDEINMAVRLAVPGEVADDVAISKLRHMLTWKTGKQSNKTVYSI